MVKRGKRKKGRLWFRVIRWVLLVLLLVGVRWLQTNAEMAETYMRLVYPRLLPVVGGFSSLLPFSLGDLFIYGSIAGLLVYLIRGIIRRSGFGVCLRRSVEYLVWVYAWFYLFWGISYFRYDFYTRTTTPRIEWSETLFRQFLTDYAESLNRSYDHYQQLTTEEIDRAVKTSYRQLCDEFKIVEPFDGLRGKPMLSSRLMSAVGVKGYMGPFFLEYTLSRSLLPVEYPATYAHEMAHALGVSSEAEANLLAYLVLTGADREELHYPGYFSLLAYVLQNAYRVLPREEFNAWCSTITPEVLTMYNEKTQWWHDQYSPLIGEVQDKIYNFYLKGNKIASGTANYGEVVGLAIAYKMR